MASSIKVNVGLEVDIEATLEIEEGKKKAVKTEYLNVELYDNTQDFLYVKGVLERSFGIKLQKVMVFKHCLIIALNHYHNGKGVDNG